MSGLLRRTIFAGCRELGLDDDARRDLQLRVTGKESLSGMDDGDLRAVIDELKSKGFRLRSNEKRAAAPRADIRFCHVMWRLLYEAGAVKVRGPAGLNAFVQKRFTVTWGYAPIDIDAMREWQEINDVVEALKDWCVREGIDLER